jgi:hypothetical protein
MVYFINGTCMQSQFIKDNLKCDVIETIPEAARILRENLPMIHALETPWYFDIRLGEIRLHKDEYGKVFDIPAYELALLTIKENGTAPVGYKSISEFKPFQVGMHVGPMFKEEGLIVSDIYQDGKLIRPVKLSLNDIIGYETLKKIGRKLN